jgi:hypothetical protein
MIELGGKPYDLDQLLNVVRREMAAVADGSAPTRGA